MTQVEIRAAAGSIGCVGVDEERCKGCGLCVKSCNKQVLALANYLNSKGYTPAKVTQPERCTGCTLCALMCPDVAIKVYRRAVKTEEKSCPTAS